MALENVSELSQVLAQRERLGLVFARHAYGMRAWVDLFSARVPAIAQPEAKALLAQLVADNARHMMLFRERALAHGVDPDAYECPAEGEAIYARIVDIEVLDELLGYALGRRLHKAYLESRISRKEIHALLHDPLLAPDRPLKCYAGLSTL